MWGLLRPKYLKKTKKNNDLTKKNKQKNTFVKGSAGAHYTRVQKFEGLTLNGVDIGI